ncbi:MAG: hypothetical protein ACK4M7_09385, partial [Burkholderiales bacterium]
PEAALEQVKNLAKDQNVQNERLKALVREHMEKAKILDAQTESKLITQWFESKDAYDWILLHESKQLKENHLTNFNFQQKGIFLKALDLRGSSLLKEASFIALYTYCPNLVYLNISGWLIEKLGYYIGKKTSLLGREVLWELHPETIFPFLQRLIAHNCRALKEIQLKLPNVISLELANNQSLINLSLNVPKLQLLDVSGHGASKEQELSWYDHMIFEGQPQLKGLILKSILAALAQTCNQLDVSKAGLDNLDIKMLVTHPILKKKVLNYTSINLSGNFITAEGANILAQYLPTNLQCLNLHGNQIGDIGVQSLAQHLPTSLQSLDLSSNNIGDTGAQALAQHLPTNLQFLNLSGNQIGDSGMTALALHLPSNLQLLNLRGNSIGYSGARTLAGYLPPNLQSLNLRSNNI